MARKQRTPRGNTAVQRSSPRRAQTAAASAKKTGQPSPTGGAQTRAGGNKTAQSTPRRAKTEATSTKKGVPKPDLKLKRSRKQKKDKKQYTKIIENLRKPDEPGSRGRSSTLLLSSSDTSRPRPKATQAFTEIVDTVQDVAVVDVRPGLQVDFARITKDKKIQSHCVQYDNRKKRRAMEINQALNLKSINLPLPAGYFTTGKSLKASPADDIGHVSDDKAFIVDMPVRREKGTKGQSHENQSGSSRQYQIGIGIESPNPTAAEMPSTSQQNKSHQITKGNFKPQQLPSPTKPNPHDVHTPSSSNNVNSTSPRQQPHPPVAQLPKIQHKESVTSAGSSGVSSGRSEMESEFSETEYMSAESGDELDTTTRALGEQLMEQEEKVDGATYDKRRARILPNTVPTHCVAVIHPLSLLPFIGQVTMSVLHGEVKVHGYHANVESNPLPLYSSKSAPAMCIETSDELFRLKKADKTSKQELRRRLSECFMKDFVDIMIDEVLREVQEHNACVIMLEPYWSDRTDYVTSFPFYKDLFEVEKWEKSKAQQRILDCASDVGFHPIKPGLQGFKIQTAPPVYHEATDPILDCLGQSSRGRKPVVMICGWKNVGKSTYARYLVNSMLNKTDAVCYLDLDVGQTEFNPSQMMGITKVTQPLLGPPFTNNTEPERMCFFGEASPGSFPSLYCDAVRYLLQYYMDYLQDLPLVVNCMGWMKGLGLSLLVDSICLIQPSHIIQLLPTPRPRQPPILDKEYLQQARGWSSQLGSRGDWDLCHMLLQMPWETDEGRRYKSANHRELSLLAYLSKLMPAKLKFHDPMATFDPLKALQPYSLPWKSVAVHVCNAEVPVSQMMYALNGSVVGLCRADTREMMSIDCDDSENLPKVCQSTPVCECFGLGIIRGIDPIHKMFYVLTHLPESTLETVNTLLKGSLALPQFLMQQGQKTGDVPYVTSEFPHGVIGSGSIKVLHMKPRTPNRSPLKQP